MSNGLNNLLDATGQAIKTVPEIYDDLFKPAVKESGIFLERIPRAINAALVGVDCWVEEKKYRLDETKKLLEKKLENVEPDKIVPPAPYVAIPALQAISYSMDSEELRDLYANLLSKAMNVDTKESVHPSFVEIIKQLSPVDALILKNILEHRVTPLIDLSIEVEQGGQVLHTYNISWIDAYPQSIINISLDNLIHLGLIDIPHDLSYSVHTHYDVVKNTNNYISAYKALEKVLPSYKGTISEKLKLIQASSLAKLFYKICILE